MTDELKQPAPQHPQRPAVGALGALQPARSRGSEAERRGDAGAAGATLEGAETRQADHRAGTPGGGSFRARTARTYHPSAPPIGSQRRSWGTVFRTSDLIPSRDARQRSPGKPAERASEASAPQRPPSTPHAFALHSSSHGLVVAPLRHLRVYGSGVRPAHETAPSKRASYPVQGLGTVPALTGVHRVTNPRELSILGL
jgi:hypothetical protein